MTRWLDPEPVDVPDALRDVVGGHPLVAETLARRGFGTPAAARAFLEPGHYTPASPTDLSDLGQAVERLREAVQRREKVAVWGDFDADGQTATALLLETLQDLGAEAVFHIPGRDDGHGLHVRGLERLIAGGTSVLLTCDTGITAHAAVARANELGADVIITDHHVPGEALPPAVAVVNPRRLTIEHPLYQLTGVGVAYQLARALSPVSAEHALDLVALGTVADVGTLAGDNRYLVQRGLEALRHTSRRGLQAIYQLAGLRPEGLSEEHVGFVLGPRLNSLGRLADATRGVELLTTADLTLARTLGTEVEGLNARRQWLTKQVTDAALEQIDRQPPLLGDYHALVLSHPEWPGGVVGIVAGRLAERFGKPVVLIAAPSGQLARGSGRSVPGVDLIAALTACATPQPVSLPTGSAQSAASSPPSTPPLFASFGGHPGAAGFSIDPDRIPELRHTLSRAIATQSETIPEATLTVDAYVDLPDITLDLVVEIGRLAPFGPGNPPLALAVRNLRLLSETTLGRNDEHRRLTVEDEQQRTQTVFWWHGADWPLPQGHFDLALTVRSSDYRGQAEVQAEWLEAREREPARAQLRSEPAIQVRDHRQEVDPESVLKNLVAEGDIQVWAEGISPAGVESRTRRALVPCGRLAVWTLPPGPRELLNALERARPTEVFVFGQHPGLDDAARLLQQLAGLVKYALRTKGGQVDLEAAAARLSHRIGTIEAALECLALQGTFAILEREDACWLLEPGPGHPEAPTPDVARARLETLLEETAAYRQYFRSAPAPIPDV
jgi:single-stranded-DNA-specific exonuclease